MITRAPVLWVHAVVRMSMLLLPMALLVLLAGCAIQRISEQSQQALAAGEYEKAIQALDQGLKEYPDSTALHSAMIQARTQAVSKMTSDAAALRSAGKLDQAQVELERALLIDPQSRRVEALLVEVAAERRLQVALAEAEQLEAKQRPDAALRVISNALKDNPRHAGLLAAQRRIEITLRQAWLEDALDLIAGANRLAKKVIDGKTAVIYPNTPEKQREYQEQTKLPFGLSA